MLRKTVIISTFLIALAVPTLAQRRQIEQGRGVERIQRALNLSPDQVNSVQALVESQRQSIEPIVKEVRDKAQALRDLQAQPNPNPTDVGNATLAMRAARERMQAAQQSFQQSLRNLLTTEQREMLDRTKQRGSALRRQPGTQGRRRNR